MYQKWIPFRRPFSVPVLAVILTAALAPPLVAQDGEETLMSASEAEQQVRERDEQERRAVLERDVDTLHELWSDRFTVNAPSHQIVRRSAVFALIENGTIHYSTFDREIEHVEVLGDVVVLMGRERVLPIGNAPNAGMEVERRFTNIWQNEDGEWRTVARHASTVEVKPTS